MPMGSKHSLWASALAAIGATICCVGPLVLVMLGIGGAWISQLSKLEPLRPFFIVATLALLAWSWHQLYRVPDQCDPSKVCGDPKVRSRQRMIFWTVTPLLLLLLTFPYYAPLFY